MTLLQWFLLAVKFTGYIDLTYGGNMTFHFIFQLMLMNSFFHQTAANKPSSFTISNFYHIHAKLKLN